MCPNAKIVVHELDAKGLCDSVLSLAYLFGFQQEKVDPDILCVDNDIIKLENTEIKVIHTPGHTEGCVCYLVDDVIFCGDTIFEGSVGRTDFPGGSFNNLRYSIQSKLYVLPSETVVYPGHGNRTTIEFEKNNNPYV